MRSSMDDAIDVFKKFQEESVFMRLVIAVKGADVVVDGRPSVELEADNVLVLRVRGRGCLGSIPLANSEFEYFEPREFPEGFSDSVFASFWQITLKDAGLATLAEFKRG